MIQTEKRLMSEQKRDVNGKKLHLIYFYLVLLFYCLSYYFKNTSLSILNKCDSK